MSVIASVWLSSRRRVSSQHYQGCSYAYLVYFGSPLFRGELHNSGTAGFQELFASPVLAINVAFHYAKGTESHH
ncbi:hypothetical protein GUJ93_ZPchr0003g18204 [Zizania palustris]|uniref:Uncharacterized protein n=1 Tax=Zizania palustris TaxID=103762 RepID=A0A8J5SVW8_ZIZPA|nr:hypothetical protein GUJ93_ZPchr0003g18204 [Zizania palustris]